LINNRRIVKCERCGKEGYLTVHAEDWEDSPLSFTMKEECKGPCEPRYSQMTAEEMHKMTGLPLSGWSETKH
jgi:hypothetical protein